MLILGLDVETTGLDKDTDEITELGAILYDTDLNQPVGFFCEYLTHSKPIPHVVEKLTGITKDITARWGIAPSEALSKFEILADCADYFCAHNAPFDRGFLEVAFREHSFTPLPNKPWIDTSSDIPFPDTITTRKLEHLGPSHGFLNPWSHRAIFDVLSMLKVLSFYNIDTVVKRAASPSVKLIAEVEKPWKDNGESTTKAKELGFRWDGTNKVWAKIMKKCDMGGAAFPFDIQTEDYHD